MPLLTEQSRRRRTPVVIGALLPLAAAAPAVNFEMRVPQLPLASNIVVFALFNLNLIVFLLLLVLLIRNLVKLWFERRQELIGAKFKTKLVLAFLALSLAPAVLIFIIASNFINKSIEGWFKPQVERPADQALAVAQTYYQNLQATALRHAQHVARVIDRDSLLGESRREALAAYLVEQQEQLGLAALTVFAPGGQELVHVKDSGLGDLPTRDVNESQLRLGLGGQAVTTVRELSSGDLIEAIVPVVTRDANRRVVGAVVVGTHVTERLEAKIRGIEQSFQEHKQLKLVKNPVNGIYILLLLLITLIVVFSFVWFGFYLARGITGPIAELAEGTREVAAGNLSYKVQAQADDEIGVLVDSFNRMTDDLAQSKRQLEEAYLDLQDKHTELEDRRRYIETVLEAITTGVVSLDPQGLVTTLNRAAAGMFGLHSAAAVGRPVDEVFGSPAFRDVVGLVARIRRAKAGVAIEQELHLRRSGVSVSLLASATALRGPEGEYTGAVIVFDDLTELLTAQRLAAWREVAQRIAHEIKNPLTPIQLSAQRLRRRLARNPGDEQLITECTETIIQEVDGLKRLVDEFSRFARMPVLTPRPTDLKSLVDAVAGLYHESHPALRLTTRYRDDLPLLEVDPDHIKRAMLNLVDNAAEAVGGTGEVDIEALHLPEAGRGQVIVSDTGPGIRPEDKGQLVIP